MTRKEAMKHLKLMQSGARNAIRFTKNNKEISEEERKEDTEIYQDQLTALNMVIKALEREPCEDAISREAVLELTKIISEDYSRERDSFRHFIEKLPPVEPQEWISVKEHGNPKEDDDYWVTFVEVEDYDADDKLIEVDIDSFCVKTQMWSHHNNANDKVVAWMPLPSPYKGNET